MPILKKAFEAKDEEVLENLMWACSYIIEGDDNYIISKI